MRRGVRSSHTCEVCTRNEKVLVIGERVSIRISEHADLANNASRRLRAVVIPGNYWSAKLVRHITENSRKLYWHIGFLRFCVILPYFWATRVDVEEARPNDSELKPLPEETETIEV
jgi:hypothetical protein